MYTLTAVAVEILASVSFLANKRRVMLGLRASMSSFRFALYFNSVLSVLRRGAVESSLIKLNNPCRIKTALHEKYVTFQTQKPLNEKQKERPKIQ